MSVLQNRVCVLELSQEILTKKKTGWSRNLDKKVLIAETAVTSDTTLTAWYYG